MSDHELCPYNTFEGKDQRKKHLYDQINVNRTDV